MITQELMESAEDTVLKYVALAEKRFNVTLPYPAVTFDVRGVVAGLAHLHDWKIGLNPDLYKRNYDEFHSRTIPHEVAHLVVQKVFGAVKQHHGPEWRHVMRTFGVHDITRCHQYDTSHISRRKQTRHVYQCGCREHMVSATKHNRIRTGKQFYLCARCNGKIRFVRDVG